MAVEKVIQKKCRRREWGREKVSLYFTSEQVTLTRNSGICPMVHPCCVSVKGNLRAQTHTHYTHTSSWQKYPYHNLTGAIMMEVWQIQRALRVQALPRPDDRLINWYCDLVDGERGMTWQLIWEKFRRWPDREQLNLFSDAAAVSVSEPTLQGK